MRVYDDPVEVRRGGPGGGDEPDQFIWRGRLWQVRDVVSHWIETKPWWLGSSVDSRSDTVADSQDLLGEQEIWRVTADAPARRPLVGPVSESVGAGGLGVFDLALSLAEGHWKLSRAVD